MQKFLLLTLSLFLVACQSTTNTSDSREMLCQTQSAYFINQLEQLAETYPLLSTYQQEATMTESKDGSFSLTFAKNYTNRVTEPAPNQPSEPFLFLSFQLSTTPETFDKAVILALDKNLETNDFNALQHASTSGVTIFTKLKCSDPVLKRKINQIYQKITNEILAWENHKISSNI